MLHGARRTRDRGISGRHRVPLRTLDERGGAAELHAEEYRDDALSKHAEKSERPRQAEADDVLHQREVPHRREVMAVAPLGERAETLGVDETARRLEHADLHVPQEEMRERHDA